MPVGVCAGQSSRSRGASRSSRFEGAAAQLMQLHNTVKHIASSSGDVVLPTLQRQLQFLLVQ